MIGARGELQLAHRRAHQALTLILQLTKLAYLTDAHIGVGNNVGGLPICKAFVLNIARSLYTGAD